MLYRHGIHEERARLTDNKCFSGISICLFRKRAIASICIIKKEAPCVRLAGFSLRSGRQNRSRGLRLRTWKNFKESWREKRVNQRHYRWKDRELKKP